MQSDKFEQWCLIELMGRQRIAGLVSERTIAGAGFLEVNVPETKNNVKFTRFIAPGSLYAINPVTEEVARQYAENLSVKPIDAWDISAFMEKVQQARLAANNAGEPAEMEEEEEEEENDYR